MDLVREIARYVLQGCTAATLGLGLTLYAMTFSASTLAETSALAGPAFFAAWLVGMITLLHKWRYFRVPLSSHGRFKYMFLGMPFWYRRCYWLLIPIALIHFSLAIVDSSKVESAIRISRIAALQDSDMVEGAAQEKRLELSGDETRLLATFVVVGSFSAFTYWWFGSGSGRPATFWQQLSTEE